MSKESTSGFLETLGCALLFLALIVIAVIALAIWLAIAVLAGVGLWYLIRFIWRKYAEAHPEAPAVQRGMKMTPLTRKVLAAIPCVILGCCLSDSQSYRKSDRIPAEGNSSSSLSPDFRHQRIPVRIARTACYDTTKMHIPSGRILLSMEDMLLSC